MNKDEKKEMVMNARQFFDKVAEMRLMQRAYFKNRDKDTLVECKRLEAEIDAEIHRVEFILKTKDSLQKRGLV